MDQKYRSRKFIVTILIFLATVGLALIGKLSAEAAQIFTGLGVAYPFAQGWVDGRKDVS